MATVKLDPAKGVQIPNLSTSERNAISSPETGALIWNTTTSAINQYNGSAWEITYTDTNTQVAGITSSADATAITIDSSENVLVGKTSQNSSLSGCELLNNGTAQFTRDGNSGLRINRLSSDGDLIRLSKDGTRVGSIESRSGVVSTIILDPRTGGAGLTGTGAGMTPTNNVGATSDNLCDLGKSTNRFKDLHLGGGVYLGGTGAAHKLDDYEEGTWTPTIVNGGSIGTVSYAIYTKVGDFVSFYLYCDNISITNNSSSFEIGGLPHQISQSPYMYGGGQVGYTNAYNWGQHGATLHVNPGGNKIYFHKNTGTTATVLQNQVQGLTYMLLSGTYKST